MDEKKTIKSEKQEECKNYQEKKGKVNKKPV